MKTVGGTEMSDLSKIEEMEDVLRVIFRFLMRYKLVVSTTPKKDGGQHKSYRIEEI